MFKRLRDHSVQRRRGLIFLLLGAVVQWGAFVFPEHSDSVMSLSLVFILIAVYYLGRDSSLFQLSKPNNDEKKGGGD